MEMIKYVMICLFIDEGCKYDDIILIKRQGKFNLVGGEVEENDENDKKAIIREVREEIGLELIEENVKELGTMNMSPVSVKVFASRLLTGDVININTKTDKEDPIIILPVGVALGHKDLLNDVRYIIEVSMKKLDNWKDADE